MTPLETAARAFATEAHASIDQHRKWTGEPYIVHPAAVAEIVRSVPHDEAMLAAAWLHDVLEDVAPLRPEFGNPEILARFGADVADLVAWLTGTSRPEDGNRAARKAIDRAHSAAAPARAQTIKVADLIDNSRTILVRDRDFARVYVPEKEALLDVLVLADPALVARAKMQLEEFKEAIDA